MENQGFNYELEAEKISDLFNQNYKLGLEAKNSFRNKTKFSLDEVLEYCKTSPNIEDAMQKYPNEILEYELDGKIKIENGKVFLN